MLRRIIVVTILFFLFVLPLTEAQQLIPRGKFIQDSMRIGEPFQYSLSFTYPKKLQVVFPDSLYDFSPLELYSREYFVTSSDSATSIDSAIYTFLSFEINSIQTLALPVFILDEGDSTPNISGYRFNLFQ